MMLNETITIGGLAASTTDKIVLNKKQIDPRSVTEMRQSAVYGGPPPVRAPLPKSLLNAVYSYIRAVRAAGRETVNTAEIAKALGYSIADVEAAARKLAVRGVRAK